jgi:hypothetical protein
MALLETALSALGIIIVFVLAFRIFKHLLGAALLALVLLVVLWLAGMISL